MISDLTKRLQEALQLVPSGETVMDIGADRGFLAKELAHQGFRVYATENKKGPYSGLVENTKEEEKGGKLTCLFSDGLSLFPSDVTMVSVLGMGGNTMYRIFSKYPERVSSLHYILMEPQSDFSSPLVYLSNLGFENVGGKFVFEKRYYPLLLMKKTGKRVLLDEAEKIFGSYPLKNRDPLLHSFLQSEKKRLYSLPNEVIASKKEEIACIERGLAYYE